LLAPLHRIEDGINAVRVLLPKCWFDESTGRAFCLVEAPDKEAANAVHREAHGLVADELIGAVLGLGKVLSTAYRDIYPAMIAVGGLSWFSRSSVAACACSAVMGPETWMDVSWSPRIS